ncbi:MAG TPA: DUF5320 domain-containing protein [Rectinema sp.]|nr:DUF5320 domain-containing protein [Rectinema sp.]
MPRHDGTGPAGDGRPGRGMGPCQRFGSNVNNNRSTGYTAVNILIDMIKSFLAKKPIRQGGKNAVS